MARLGICRFSRDVSAIVSDRSAVELDYNDTDVFRLTYLEVGF